MATTALHLSGTPSQPWSFVAKEEASVVTAATVEWAFAPKAEWEIRPERTEWAVGGKAEWEVER